MKPHVAMTGIVLSALLWGSACEELEGEEPVEQPVAVALEPLRADYSYERRDDFRVEMERAIHQIDRRASELKARVARAGEHAPPARREALDEAEAGLADLRREVNVVRSVTRDQWDQWTTQFKIKAEALGRRIEDALRA